MTASQAGASWTCGNPACALTQAGALNACVRCGTLRIGLVLNGVTAQYRIDQFHAMGGMGVLHRGTATGTGTAVAIKSIRVDPNALNDPDQARGRKDFQTETDTLRRLGASQPPGLVQFLDHIDDPASSLLCLVMQFVDGQNLRELVESYRVGANFVGMPVQVFLKYAIQMARTLSWLQGQNVVHRDVNPLNLILDRNTDQLTLVDFGSARGINQGGTVAAGKRGYWSIEQIQGKLIHKSDVYGFGATLFYMLTGTEPSAVAGRLPKVSGSGAANCDAEVEQLVWDSTEPAEVGRPDATQVLERLLQIDGRINQSGTGQSVGSRAGTPSQPVHDAFATVRISTPAAPTANPTILIQPPPPPPPTLPAPTASLGARAIALMIDLLVIGIGCVGLALISAYSSDLALMLMIMLFFGYYVISWTTFQATFGMRIFRLKLVTDSGARVSYSTAFVRTLALILSLSCVGLGYLWALSGDRRLSLHDHLSQSRIVSSAP